MKGALSISFAVAFVTTVTIIAHAQPSIDAQIEKSGLTLSAFECSILAQDPNEKERLFRIGLRAGRDFLEFMKRDPHAVLGKRGVATLWRGVAVGPSIDFSLGRVFQFMSQEVIRLKESRNPDPKFWDSLGSELYKEKNCAFVKGN